MHVFTSVIEGCRVRSIAIGYPIRKMAATLLLKSIAEHTQAFVDGVNFGLGANGTEKVFHAISIIFDKHHTWDLVAMDKRNAFNLIKRALVAEEVFSSLPDPCKLFQSILCNCYSTYLKNRMIQR